MKSLSKTLGAGLLTLIAGCAGSPARQIESQKPLNQTITLTPSEKLDSTFRTQFCKTYSLA
ncbi:MAG: hypothetical protein Q8L52_01080, partial [bacterium]|nr:hypothetical protein [bacterium]